jgi:hypothetical protein
MTTAVNDELRQEVLSSKKFIQWRISNKTKPSYGRGEDFNYTGERYTNLVVDEKHFTPSELAKAWGVSAETVRQLFRNEPDVLRVGSNGSTDARRYVLLRIPESVAVRVHRRLSAIPK